MKVKKYIAPSMQEAMKKIRSEMGNDAVILNSKVIQTGGFLGLFTKKMIEVIAVMDPDVPVHPKSSDVGKNHRNEKPMINNGVTEKEQPLKILKNRIEEQQFINEIQEMKGLLQTLAVNEKSEMYPEALKRILQQLTAQEIDPLLRSQIMKNLLDYWYHSGGNITNEQLKSKTKELLYDEIADLEFGGISYQKKYINVIGPTGVGKTTTLAKLAAECVLKKQKKVAFITTDTYRIAAIDQLKTYAEILDVPIEVCYSLTDFKEAKQKLENYDYIFIDTAGRNFLEEKYVKDLQAIIDFNDEIETYLVLAATAKPSDMLEVYDKFSIIPIHKLIFTKLDETSSKGSLIEIMRKTKIGIAYLTNGQNVPDDIEVASKELIIEQILR